MIKYYYVATITKEENILLDSKYRNDMPDDWKPGDDIKARYTEIGISVQPTKLFDD